MRALALEHLHSNPIGVYGDVLAARGIEVDRVLLDRGETLPDWQGYDLLVVMGGGMSAYDDGEFPWLAAEKRTIRDAVTAGVPYFGVCLGSQLLASALGARVYRGAEPELGVSPVFLSEAARRDPVFRGLAPDLEVFEWHSDTFELPEGATRLARSPRYENQAFRFGEVAYAIQCHLETTYAQLLDWFAAWPSLGETFERRYGPGALDAFLDEYARSVPRLQRTARQLFRRWLENALVHGRSLGRPSRTARARRGLVGRDVELDRIASFLDRLRAGDGSSLTLVGPPGIGKTALLAAARDLADGVQVVAIAGVERAAPVPLAGLSALCAPFTSYLDRVSEPRRDALATALGLDAEAARRPAARRATEPTADDRFAAHLGALELLGAAAAEQPLLLLVDDLEALDESSREAVETIAGAAGGPLAVLASSAERPRSGIDVAEVRPLVPADSMELLADSFGAALIEPVAREIAAVAGGNPLALLELARVLTAGQRTGREPATPVLSVCRSAEQAFLRRAGALPTDARRALLVLALGNGEPASVIDAALASLGVGTAALELAGGQDLLVGTADGSFTFRHDLARTVVAYGALRGERRETHAALARATEEHALESQAWHRARAVDGEEETAALSLARAGEDARARGAFATAASAFDLAAAITPSPTLRAERLLDGAVAAHAAGHVAAALDHVESALEQPLPPERQADAELLYARILARAGSAGRARDVLLAAAERPTCPASVRARLLTEAVLPTLRAGDPAGAIRVAREASSLATGADVLAARVGLATALSLGGEHIEARDVARDALATSRSAAVDPRLRAYLGSALRFAGEYDDARHELEHAVRAARASGAVGTLGYALVRLADVELDQGDWAAAAAGLRTAEAVAHETGQAADRGLAAGGLAWLAAAQGRAGDCEHHAARALDLAERLGQGSRLDRALPSLGLLALGHGDHASAVDALGEVRAVQQAQGWSDAAVRPHRAPDLVEALQRAGHVARAREEAASFEAEAARTGRASARALAARCLGTLTDGAEADHWFEAALSTGPEVTGPFEAGRTRLAYGEHLIAANRRDEALPHLAAARTAFASLGAEPWTRRAAALA